MRYLTLLERAAHLPVIDSKTLRSFGGDPKALSVQLSRWVRDGKLFRCAAEPICCRRAAPQPASRWSTSRTSWCCRRTSVWSALGFHGLIPERVPLVQSVTLRGPCYSRRP
jgi:hypothetical protein